MPEVQCDVCEEPFDTEHSMKVHRGRMHGQQQVECDYCGEEFKCRPRRANQENVFCDKTCAGKYNAPDARVNFTLEPAVGYPHFAVGGNRVFVHSLVAISNGADPYKVFGNSQWNVDHKNGCKIDNRPDNIELLNVRDHGRKDGGKHNRYSHSDLLAVVSFFVDPARYND